MFVAGYATSHPNHPDTPPDDEGRIPAEADAYMAELAGSLAAAEDFARNGEALLEDLGELIYIACRVAGKYEITTAKAVIGGFVLDLIRAAAMKRAAHLLEQA